MTNQRHKWVNNRSQHDIVTGMSKEFPEILAPVGTWEMCLAAVHNGADAIYLGMPGFNARGRTETLSIETLKQMIQYCHLYEVKVFVAFNVLVFEQEFAEVTELLREIIPLGVDAFIVQDIGLVTLIKSLAPTQAIHASTQMTITCSEAIDATIDLDIDRYVLARELSLNEISAIRNSTDKELEVFVHGALCVSYSGQCLTSESLGGRSANRGQCAQSCRLPYDILVDGEKKELNQTRYLVSPQDLCSLAEVAELQKIGVDSFKIEGRLKSPEYVAATTRAYKEGIHSTAKVADLAITYSRGFFSGWLHGVDHQQLVRGDFSSHVGLEIGVISAIDRSSIILTSHYPLKRGQGLLFLDSATERRTGGALYHVEVINNNTYRVELSHDFDLTLLTEQSLVFLNSSPELQNELQGSFSNRERLKRIPVKAVLSAKIGARLELSLRDANGIESKVTSEQILETAKSSPLSFDRAFAELSALSATPYILTTLEFSVDSSGYVAERTLRKLRQKATQQLSQLRNHREPLSILEVTEPVAKNPVQVAADKPPCLLVLLRDESQIDALADLDIDTAYLDFEYGKEYERAISKIRRLGIKAGIATTRVLKPKELGHLKYLEKLSPDLILVRNLGAFHYFADKGIPLVGDFSLNITNARSADWFITQGLSTLTPSYDLNQSQLEALIDNSVANAFEVTIHQYMPAFHMEHCVFAACLSTGSSWRDCGKPCEKHRVELRTQSGALHPLKADAECRNTMFNGQAQSAARLFNGLSSRGVRRFRFEALFESTSDLRTKLDLYSSFIAGKISVDALFNKCHALDQYGVSDGQLLSIGNYNDRKKQGGLITPVTVNQLLLNELQVPRP